GTIAGAYRAAGGFSRAACLRPGDVADLGVSSDWSRAEGINDVGEVVGTWGLPGGGSHAFLRTARGIRDLGTLGGSDSEASAINDRGQVAGTARTPTWDEHAFLYERGRMQDLGTLGGAQSRSHGLNAAGQVVGDAELADGRCHAFLHRGG